jgi:hypothetical protein
MRPILIRLLGFILPLLLLMLAVHLFERALWRLLGNPPDRVEFSAMDSRLLPPPVR